MGEISDRFDVDIFGYIRISQSLKYVKYQTCSAFYPDFKCAEFCQFLFNISGCKRFTLKPAEKSTCAPTSLMVAHSRPD